MNREQLLQAIAEFDENGYSPASQELYCFQYKGRWYPAAYVVGRAVGFMSNVQHPEGQIAKVLPYTRFKKVYIVQNQPCLLNESDKWEELVFLAQRISEIVRPNGI